MPTSGFWEAPNLLRGDGFDGWHSLPEKRRKQMRSTKESVRGGEAGEELVQQPKEIEPLLNRKRKQKDARNARKSQLTSPEKRMFPKKTTGNWRDGGRRGAGSLACGRPWGCPQSPPAGLGVALVSVSTMGCGPNN